MSKLNYDELILLDIFIYLEWDVPKNTLLSDLVCNILKDDMLDYLLDNMDTCLVKMPKSHWINNIELIKYKTNLNKLRIYDIRKEKNKIRAACFIDDNNDATVIFRGSSTRKDWKDNGQGAYEDDTSEQLQALSYINDLNIDNLTVSGHSKGGNKAQYVTILSPKVERCISINGQGFSNEFIEKYKSKIEENSNKITCINCKYDYVHCLLNSISKNTHYINTEVQINPFFYHKCNLLLDKKGDLRSKSKRTFFSKIINDFSISLNTDLPKELRVLVMDGLMGVVEIVLCKDYMKENIFKIGSGILILLMYGQYFKYKESFAISYSILQMVIIPLLFWNDFIDIEETNSKEKLINLAKKIQLVGNQTLSTLTKIINKDEKEIAIFKNIQNSFDKFIINLYEEGLL